MIFTLIYYILVCYPMNSIMYFLVTTMRNDTGRNMLLLNASRDKRESSLLDPGVGFGCVCTSPRCDDRESR
jgi:hypothetical protein